MKAILKILSLFFCYSSILSCTSKQEVNSNITGHNVDSVFINDSIAAANMTLSCDTPYRSVDVVLITDQTDEQTYYGALYHQNNNKGQLLSRGGIVKNPTDIFVTNLILRDKITEKALHYLAEYIDKNCDCKAPIVKSDETSVPGLYIFGLRQGVQSKSCFVSLIEADFGLNYFKGLKIWLESSKYKNEYKEFLSYIDGVIANIEHQQIKRVGK